MLATMSPFADLVEEFFRGYWKLHPVEASIAGVGDHDGELGDHSRRGFAERDSFARAWERRLAALGDLAPAERVDRDVLLAHLRAAIALAPQQLWARQPSLYVRDVLDGAHSVLAREDVPLEERLARIAARLARARAACDAAVANLDADRTAPVHVVVAGEMAAAGATFVRAYLPSVAPEGPAKRDLLIAGQEAAAAFERFAAWLRDDVMKRARGSVAIGRDVLDALLRRHHLIALDAASLLRLAREATEETTSELEEVATALGARDWERALDDAKEDHPAADALVAEYREAVDAARDTARSLGEVPSAEGELLAVVEAPEYLRTTHPYVTYVPPPGARLQVTTPDRSWPAKDVEQRLRGHARPAIALRALQHAYPGTHVFSAHARVHPSPVRRAFPSRVTVAGWSLYAADLLPNDEPRARLFRLADRRWRAARAIVDIGLATGELNFEQSVKVLAEAARLERPNAVAEARRASLAPAESLADLAGWHALTALRSRAMERGLDAREFHSRLFAAGALPPALLAAEVLR